MLNSWSPVQQLVYHLLRFFAKKELIEKQWTGEDEILSNYHIKTVMLWCCEEEPQSWWLQETFLYVCCRILRKLAVCLLKRSCRNYFVPQCNLFRHKMNEKNADVIVDKLLFRTRTSLAEWFKQHYIDVAMNHYISKQLIITANLKMFVDAYDDAYSEQIVKDFGSVGFGLLSFVQLKWLDGVTCSTILQSLPTIDDTLIDYFKACVYLKVRQLISRKQLNYECQEILDLLGAITKVGEKSGKIHPISSNLRSNSTRIYIVKTNNLIENLIRTTSSSERLWLPKLCKKAFKHIPKVQKQL